MTSDELMALAVGFLLGCLVAGIAAWLFTASAYEARAAEQNERHREALARVRERYEGEAATLRARLAARDAATTEPEAEAIERLMHAVRAREGFDRFGRMEEEWPWN